MSGPLSISFAFCLLNSSNRNANYIDTHRIRRPEGIVQTDTAPRRTGASAGASTNGTDDVWMNTNAILDRNMRLYGLPLESSDINHVPITFFPLFQSHCSLIVLCICEHHSVGTLDT